jgi:hypothetical protein
MEGIEPEVATQLAFAVCASLTLTKGERRRVLALEKGRISSPVGGQATGHGATTYGSLIKEYHDAGDMRAGRIRESLWQYDI